MLRRSGLPKLFPAAAASAAAATFTPPKNVKASTIRDTLRAVTPVTYSSLTNGFRVATEHNPKLDFVTIGVWIDAGSRFETRANNGVAHYLEHLNFKGTKNFTRKDIETTFEYLGAHFNAYTARDRTAYYIKVRNSHADKVIHLLSDIFKHSEYKVRDIELERNTILAEMKEVESLVDEVIMDNLHLTAFDADTCGLPLTILGPTQNIAKHIDRQMVQEYVDVHYTGPRMSLVCVGGLAHREVEKLAEKYFGDLSPKNNRPKLAAKYTGGDTHMFNNNMPTTHVAWAMNICGAQHQDTIPLCLLQSVIGTYRREHRELHLSQAMNSSLPDLPGLEACTPFYTPYEETGLLGYYMITVPGAPGTNDRRASEMTTAMNHTLNNMLHLCNYPISDDQLEQAKAHFKAIHLIAMDSTTNSAEDLGRQMIHFGRRVPINEVFEKIDAVTPKILQETLAKYFYNCRPVMSCVGPADTLPVMDEWQRMIEKIKQ